MNTRPQQLNARPQVKAAATVTVTTAAPAPAPAPANEEVGFECEAQYMGMVVTDLGFPSEAELTTEAFVALSARVQGAIKQCDVKNGIPPRSNIRLVATPTGASFNMGCV